MRPIFKTKMVISHSMANLGEKILLGKITHHLDLEIKKMMVRTYLGTRIQHSILVHNLLANEIKFYRVSQRNCATFDEILKNKENTNRLMER